MRLLLSDKCNHGNTPCATGGTSKCFSRTRTHTVRDDFLVGIVHVEDEDRFAELGHEHLDAVHERDETEERDVASRRVDADADDHGVRVRTKVRIVGRK